MKKQPVVQSAIASEDPRDEISEYDVFENLKEIEIEKVIFEWLSASKAYSILILPPWIT